MHNIALQRDRPKAAPAPQVNVFEISQGVEFLLELTRIFIPR